MISEQKDLLAAAREGDREACQEIIRTNDRLIWSIVQRYSGRGVELEDLFQLGCIGFLKAIRGFDPQYGTCFSTYAVPMIIGEIRRYLRDNSAMRVSRAMRDTAYKVLQAKETYMAQHQKEPTVEEIARILQLRREDVVFALDAIQAPVSLNEPVYNDSGDALYVMDQISDKKNKEERWIEDLSLQAAMEHLNEREKYIIRLRFFEGKTQMEVAKEVKISQAQVSRLEKNALRLMRQYLD